MISPNGNIGSNIVNSLVGLGRAGTDVFGSRYSFQGQEKDDEILGASNSIGYEARMYDTRIGKFLSRDPKEKDFAFLTPYCLSSNNPILLIDENGEGPILPFQSLYVSQQFIKPLIDKYNSGEIGYDQLQSAFDFYMNQAFSSVVHSEYAEDQFYRNGLNDGQGIYSSGDALTYEDGTYKYPSSEVLYDGGFVYDVFTYVTLIDEDDNGNWVEIEYKIYNPLLADFVIESANTARIDALAQLAVNEMRINALKASNEFLQSAIDESKYSDPMEGGVGGFAPLEIKRYEQEQEILCLEQENAMLRESISGIENKIKMYEDQKTEMNLNPANRSSATPIENTPRPSSESSTGTTTIQNNSGTPAAKSNNYRI